MLVRDIIDIDSTYEDFEALNEDDDSKINKKSKSVFGHEMARERSV